MSASLASYVPTMKRAIVAVLAVIGALFVLLIVLVLVMALMWDGTLY